MNLGDPAAPGSPNAGKTLRSGQNGYGWYDDATGAPISNSQYMQQATGAYNDRIGAHNNLDNARTGLVNQAADAIRGNTLGLGQSMGQGGGQGGGPPPPPNMGMAGMAGGGFPAVNMSGMDRAAGYQPSPLQAPRPMGGLPAPREIPAPGQFNPAPAPTPFTGGPGPQPPLGRPNQLPAYQPPPPPPNMGGGGMGAGGPPSLQQNAGDAGRTGAASAPPWLSRPVSHDPNWRGGGSLKGKIRQAVTNKFMFGR